ncbi:iron-containing alcohol dehydrogenase [Treponema primitia]|uniref:iron-containing alcohol dehydrogenase n=1 Tax=Treponema primitia TaxID=88058 RepID=UPI00397EF460
MQFTFNLPVNLLFGSGKAGEIGRRAALLGKTALIVTGRGSTKKSGLLDRVTGLLRESGLTAIVYDKVEPNPLTTQVYEGAALAKEKGCDLVIGLGGGSILDASKAIAFMVKNDGDLMDYIYGRKTPGDALPMILVPTTCGTGSEGNSFAVITDPRNGDKKSLRSNAIIGNLSIIDPELMVTMPKPILASVGFDALCHSMEAYISAIATPVTDLYALEGIRLIRESLVPLYTGKSAKGDWEKLSWASTLGGMAIGLAGVTAPHGIEHPPSGLRNIVHGRGLAALTPVIYERSVAAAPEKFAEISRRLGGKDETDLVGIIKKLLADIDLTITLGQQGVNADDIDWMAENTLRVSAAGIANHPVKFGLEDIKDIYRQAL